MKPAIWRRSTEKSKKSSFFLTLLPWDLPIRFHLAEGDSAQAPPSADGDIQGIRHHPENVEWNETPATSRSTRFYDELGLAFR
jgi:hypothetical protein